METYLMSEETKNKIKLAVSAAIDGVLSKRTEPLDLSVNKPSDVYLWMKRHGKEPAYDINQYLWRKARGGRDDDSTNSLPKNIADVLPVSHVCGQFAIYDTREAAIAALDAALRKCGELAESKVTSPGVVKAVENIVNNPSVLTEPAEDWPINPPSPLAALAEKWEKSYKAHAAAMEGQNEREFELHEVYAGTFRECAAELRAALAAVEPSEEEMEKAGVETCGGATADSFVCGVRWMLAKIKGSK